MIRSILTLRERTAQSTQSTRGVSVPSPELGPPLGSKGGDTLACEGGGPNSDEGTDRLHMELDIQSLFGLL